MRIDPDLLRAGTAFPAVNTRDWRTRERVRIARKVMHRILGVTQPRPLYK